MRLSGPLFTSVINRLSVKGLYPYLSNLVCVHVMCVGLKDWNVFNPPLSPAAMVSSQSTGAAEGHISSGVPHSAGLSSHRPLIKLLTKTN